MTNPIFRLFLLTRRVLYLSLVLFDQIILRRKNTIFILSYHSIFQDTWRFSVDPEVFKQQIVYLKERYEFITLHDLDEYLQGKKDITKPSVILTIDDGYQDILELQSFLEANAITPTLFVLAHPEKPNWKELGSKRAFLTTSEIKSLHKKGWEIGCHSATHANLSELSQDKLHEEISQAKKDLEKELNFSLPYFAYPRGKYTTEVIHELKNANFRLGLTMDDGFISRNTPLLQIPRIGVDRTHTFGEFKASFSPTVVGLRKLIKQTPVGRYL